MTDYIFRPMAMEDINAFHTIYGLESIEIYGSFAMPLNELLIDWTVPGFNIVTDTMAAFTADGEIAGWTEVRDYRTPPVRPYLYGYVHPEHRGQGMGSRLIQWGVERAKQVFQRLPSDVRVVLQAFSTIDNGKTLLEANNFVKYRETLIMQIDMNEPPPQAQFPASFQVQTMTDGATLLELVQTARGAFRDHRGWVDRPLEEDLARWQHDLDSFPDAFDPGLYMLLKDRDTPAGEIMTWPISQDSENKAEVRSLGILPAYRRRGLAKQLLYTAFNAAYQRGKRSVRLGVDGSSLTGAHLVYQKAGMYIAQVYNAYELELRPGIEISNQG